MQLVRHSAAAISALLGAPLVAAGLALHPRWRDGWRERLGRRPQASPGSVWVHAASVGEVRASLNLLDGLHGQGDDVAASTMTTTGRALLRELRPAIPCALAPLDHPWCVDAALRRVRPSALVLVETELWPAWIAAAARSGATVAVVSGRISDRSLPRYRRLAPLLRRTWQRIAAVGARSERDAERFLALGALPGRVEVTGDLKLEPPLEGDVLAADLQAALGETSLFVAGSTHAGEEEAALAVLAAAERAGRALALVLAPRHLARLAAVVAACERAGRPPRRRSRLGTQPLRPGEVLLLDSVGELPGVYGRAALAFVGGTLVPVGGHNLLEPLRHAVPVLFGPHTENAPEAAALVEGTGAGARVSDAEELCSRAMALLASPDAGRAGSRRGQRALESHRGATERTLALLARARGRLGERGAGSC